MSDLVVGGDGEPLTEGAWLLPLATMPLAVTLVCASTGLSPLEAWQEGGVWLGAIGVARGSISPTHCAHRRRRPPASWGARRALLAATSVAPSLDLGLDDFERASCIDSPSLLLAGTERANQEVWTHGVCAEDRSLGRQEEAVSRDTWLAERLDQLGCVGCLIVSDARHSPRGGPQHANGTGEDGKLFLVLCAPCGSAPDHALTIARRFDARERPDNARHFRALRRGSRTPSR